MKILICDNLNQKVYKELETIGIVLIYLNLNQKKKIW